MPLESLLLSHDPKVLALVRRISGELSIGLAHADSLDAATDLLARNKFDAVITDCDGLAGGAEFIHTLRQGRSNRSAIVFAVIPDGAAHGSAAKPQVSVRQAFEQGANFVLDKPLLYERTLRSFRAALGLMVRERLRYFRLDVALPLTIELPGGERLQTTTSNLSEGGVAFKAPRKLAHGTLLAVSLSLVGMRNIEVRGEVVWTREDGCAGLRFLPLSDTVRQELACFLGRAQDARDLTEHTGRAKRSRASA